MANGIDGCMTRKPWELPFLAEPEEVAALRRVVRLHLRLWGLSDVADAAEICVSELAANVIRHVGAGTPSTLVVEMNGTRLRLGLRDPDTRELPRGMSVGLDAETGRGLALVEAVSDRWGVILGADSKLVWCDLATQLASPNGHVDQPWVTRSEACLTLYGAGAATMDRAQGRAGFAVQQETAIALIADLLHWLCAHGCDPDAALDRAQMRFESTVTAR
ncbi:ATP-binding protein [Streptomyces gelaticus]|uniref:ATP-binding protein n=1 Tax=Streptomyces gelaticus TaxID=285446 RepID=UPI0027E49228|nr:ATP-binding protein [Streptomyces gelaticus]